MADAARLSMQRLPGLEQSLSLPLEPFSHRRENAADDRHMAGLW
jgi:hypothetical protein